jgi:hypothetical protein
MKRVILASCVLLPLGLILLGCGGSNKSASTGKAVKTDKTESHEESEARKPLAFKERATLKGQVTLASGSAAPKWEPLADLLKHKDCHDTPKEEQGDLTWIVDDTTRGVENVVVWVQPTDPEKFYFVLSDQDKDRKGKKVVLHQPHCAFLPRVLTLFSYYYDGKDYAKTGEVLEVVNDAKFPHNTNIQGDQLAGNTWNRQLAPQETQTIDLKPQRSPINVKCDIHQWMRAKILVFEHPFFAKTDKEGRYEIKNVPAGVKVSVVAWHEGAGYLLPQGQGSESGQELEFRPGETRELNITIQRK